MNRRRLTTKEGLQFARMAVTSFAKWEQLSDGVVKIFSYDRMIAEPKMTCRLMGEFLGVELSDTEIDSIADKCSVASLKTRLDNATEKRLRNMKKWRGTHKHWYISLILMGGPLGRVRMNYTKNCSSHLRASLQTGNLHMDFLKSVREISVCDVDI